MRIHARSLAEHGGGHPDRRLTRQHCTPDHPTSLGSIFRPQNPSQSRQPNGFGAGIQGKTILAGMDDKPLIRFKIIASNVKSTFQLGGGAALDFNRP